MERERQKNGGTRENFLLWRSGTSTPYVCPQDVLLFIFYLTMLLATLTLALFLILVINQLIAQILVL